jgi:hypothetical protein
VTLSLADVPSVPFGESDLAHVALGSDSERLAMSTTSPEYPQKAEVVGTVSHFRVGHKSGSRALILG